ncbi:MAG: DMT family transporter [Actinobacteria bacterium]|nr:DMT family transporter [Actinomycetota bacterium]NCU78229.1 DMT family transporter [Actinomycetota bacterium]NCU96623.1 DMT family transporter [Actinomycetota bacterium]
MKSKILLYIGLLATTAIWGGSFLIMKDSLERQNVYSFLATRFVLASLIMFAFNPKSLVGLNKVFIKRAVFAGMLTSGGFIFQTFGLTQTTVSNTGFITGLYLVFTPLIAWLLLKHKITKAQWGAVLVATMGLYLIAYNGISVGVGEILVLVSAVMFAAQIVAVGEWSDGKNSYPLTLIQIMVAAVVFSIFTIKDGYQLPPDSSVWSAVIFTAVFATFFGFLIQVRAQAVMSATVAGVLLAMETPFALFFGLYFDNDPLTLRIMSGGTLVMLAMAMVIWSDSKKSSKDNMRSKN